MYPRAGTCFRRGGPGQGPRSGAFPSPLAASAGDGLCCLQVCLAKNTAAFSPERRALRPMRKRRRAAFYSGGAPGAPAALFPESAGTSGPGLLRTVFAGGDASPDPGWSGSERALRLLSFFAAMQPGGADGIFHEHGNGHRANAAGHRGYFSGDFPGSGKIYVAR